MYWVTFLALSNFDLVKFTSISKDEKSKKLKIPLTLIYLIQNFNFEKIMTSEWWNNILLFFIIHLKLKF